MEKCLVTKLDGVSADNSLLRIGEIRIEVLPHSNFTREISALILSCNGSVTMTVNGNGSIGSNNNPSLYGKEHIFTGKDNNIVFSTTNEGYTCSLIKKYDLTKFSRYFQDYNEKGIWKVNTSMFMFSKNLETLNISYTDSEGSLDDLSSLVNLKELNISKTKISGKLSSIINLTNLEILELTNTQISGTANDLINLKKLKKLSINGHSPISVNISELGGITSLTNLQIGGNRNITGTFENFVSKQRENGRTSCSEFTISDAVNVTFNGSALSKIQKATWTASEITVGDVTITA